MIEEIFIYLQFTPFWVYTIFILILYYGVVSCLPHTKDINSSTIMSFIILIIYLYNLSYSLTTLFYFLIASIIGSFLGFIEPLRQNTKISEKNHLLFNGHWLTLLVLIISFSGHYYIGAIQDNENLSNLKHTEVIVYAFLAGFVSSYFLFQSISCSKLYKVLHKKKMKA